MRLYFKTRTPFEKLVKRLGANHVEDENGEDDAIFVAPGGWKKLEGDDYKVKAAIRWKRNGGVDVGQIRNDCDNYEDKTQRWYKKRDIQWIINTLQKIRQHMKE